MPEDLLIQINSAKQKGMGDDLKEITTIFSEENKSQINFIITLGGDGTILWAAKQFNTGICPPMITFAQGSLGFMCNFTFEDHEEVLRPVFLNAKNTVSQNPIVDETIGLEKRLRLKVNPGPET